MKVNDILSVIESGTIIKIYQKPILRIDKCEEHVLRQIGEVSILASSNKNYLDYDVVEIKQSSGLLAIVCKANEEQEAKVIAAFYNGDK